MDFHSENLIVAYFSFACHSIFFNEFSARRQVVEDILVYDKASLAARTLPDIALLSTQPYANVTNAAWNAVQSHCEYHSHSHTNNATAVGMLPVPCGMRANERDSFSQHLNIAYIITTSLHAADDAVFHIAIVHTTTEATNVPRNEMWTKRKRKMMCLCMYLYLSIFSFSFRMLGTQFAATVCCAIHRGACDTSLAQVYWRYTTTVYSHLFSVNTAVIVRMHKCGNLKNLFSSTSQRTDERNDPSSAIFIFVSIRSLQCDSRHHPIKTTSWRPRQKNIQFDNFSTSVFCVHKCTRVRVSVHFEFEQLKKKNKIFQRFISRPTASNQQSPFRESITKILIDKPEFTLRAITTITTKIRQLKTCKTNRMWNLCSCRKLKIFFQHF